MKSMLAVAAVAAVVMSPVFSVLAQQGGDAGGQAPVKKVKAARAEATVMTVAGKITVDTAAVSHKGKAITRYVLTDASGNKVQLPRMKASGDAPAIKLEDYVDKDVTITGKGFSTERNGVKMTRLVEITKIEAVVAAPAAAPAAPAAVK
jgi:hypothetical protein